MVLLATLVNHAIWRHAAQFHDELQLFLLIVSREYWLAGVKFGQDATETPDINLFRVLNSKDHLW